VSACCTLPSSPRDDPLDPREVHAHGSFPRQIPPLALVETVGELEARSQPPLLQLGREGRATCSVPRHRYSWRQIEARLTQSEDGTLGRKKGAHADAPSTGLYLAAERKRPPWPCRRAAPATRRGRRMYKGGRRRGGSACSCSAPAAASHDAGLAVAATLVCRRATGR
jgi:hypothetical protein